MTAPVEPVDLDEVLARFQTSQPGEVHDPQQVAEIAARCRYDRLPWLERLVTRKPKGYRARATGPVN